MKYLLLLLVCTSAFAESFDLGVPATTIECKWIAKHEGGLRFERTNGQLDSIPASDMKWVSNIKGKVLESTPLIDVVEHRMHCTGGKCEPTRTVVHEVWPERSDRLPKPLTK